MNSLDAQRARMKAYADFNDYEIVGEYEDAGKSGKSIEGRMQFRQMMEDVIDSSKDAGKLMISVLSAVAEIERENIRVQTMEGRIQKAREGKWNGGFAPYGWFGCGRNTGGTDGYDKGWLWMPRGKEKVHKNEILLLLIFFCKQIFTYTRNACVV